MDGWIDDVRIRYLDGWMLDILDGLDGWMVRWIDGWIDFGYIERFGWMDGWMDR